MEFTINFTWIYIIYKLNKYRFFNLFWKNIK